MVVHSPTALAATWPAATTIVNETMVHIAKHVLMFVKRRHVSSSCRYDGLTFVKAWPRKAAYFFEKGGFHAII